MTSSKTIILQPVRRCRRELDFRITGTNLEGSNPCQSKLKCSRKSSIEITHLTFLINLVKSSSVQTSSFLSQALKCSIIHKLSPLRMDKLRQPCHLTLLLRRLTWVSITHSSRQSFKLSKCCRNSSYSRLLSRHRTQCPM